MESQKNASFQLKGFSIPKFTFEEPISSALKIDIHLHPSGTYNTSNGEYTLLILFKAESKPNKSGEIQPFIEATIKGLFILDSKPKKEEIPEYFFQNSLAIIFPYIRSFISTMTLQAGLPLVILPVLNLMHLSNELKENTTVFE